MCLTYVLGICIKSLEKEKYRRREQKPAVASCPSSPVKCNNRWDSSNIFECLALKVTWIPSVSNVRFFFPYLRSDCIMFTYIIYLSFIRVFIRHYITYAVMQTAVCSYISRSISHFDKAFSRVVANFETTLSSNTIVSERCVFRSTFPCSNVLTQTIFYSFKLLYDGRGKRKGMVLVLFVFKRTSCSSEV